MRFIKPHITLFIFCLSILWQGCKNNDKTAVEQEVQTDAKTDTLSQKDNSNKQDRIIIKAISKDDPEALGHISFLNYTHFTGGNPEDVIESQHGDTAVFNIGNIKQPQIIEVFALGNTALYNTRLFVNPGDSIVLSFENGNLFFSGKRINESNFFNALDPDNDDYLLNPYQGNLADYKLKTQKIYERRNQFFQQFITKNKMSDEFTRQVGAELKFEFLYNLMAPRSVKIDGIKGFANDPDFIEVVSGNNAVYGEGLPNLKTYFEALEVTDFNHPELINNDYFKRALVSYIRYYFTGHEYLNYSLENFTDEKNFITNNFTGSMKEYALTRLIYDYHKKGFGNGKAEKETAYNFISDLMQTVENTSYKNELQHIKEELDFMGNSLPQSVMVDLLVNAKNDTLTFGKILNQNKGKTLVLDFWASWCSPCLKEIEASAALRSELETQKNVVWVFISTDYHHTNWIKGLTGLDNRVKKDLQYRILDTEQSHLTGYLTKNKQEIFLIPRYVVIAPEGEVVSANAPRPTEQEAFKKLF